MKDVVIDIETGPLPDEQLKLIEPEFEAPGNLKDPAKIEAAKIEARNRWYDKAALSAETGKVLAIGYFDGEDVRLDHGDEATIIKSFWDTWPTPGAPTRIIGHNLLGFDMPYLLRRSWALNLQVPDSIRPDGRWSMRLKDTMLLWMAGTRDMISLKNLARVLGCGEKSGSGADFARLYQDEATRAEALAYLENDLRVTWAVWERLRGHLYNSKHEYVPKKSQTPEVPEVLPVGERIVAEARKFCADHQMEYGLVVESRSRRHKIAFHRHALWRHLGSVGFDALEIGNALGVSRSSVSKLLNEPPVITPGANI